MFYSKFSKSLWEFFYITLHTWKFSCFFRILGYHGLGLVLSTIKGGFFTWPAPYPKVRIRRYAWTIYDIQHLLEPTIQVYPDMDSPYIVFTFVVEQSQRMPRIVTYYWHVINCLDTIAIYIIQSCEVGRWALMNYMFRLDTKGRSIKRISYIL